MDECGRVSYAGKEDEKGGRREEEPRCVFFSGRGRCAGKKKEGKKEREKEGEKTSQLKRKKIIVKERQYNEKKRNREEACEVLSFHRKV